MSIPLNGRDGYNTARMAGRMIGDNHVTRLY